MIAYVYGTVEDITADNVVIDVNRIGYNVKISPATAQALPSRGQEVKLYTYTSVREDAFLLYGFLSKEELEFFKLLITVNGIGPKAGLSILSAMDVQELRFAIIAQDARKIAKAPGVGSKTAQRIILDLKDKISLEDALMPSQSADSIEKVDNQAKAEAIEALVSLGYSATEATKAVQSIANDKQYTAEELLKETLKTMSFLK